MLSLGGDYRLTLEVANDYTLSLYYHDKQNEKIQRYDYQGSDKFEYYTSNGYPHIFPFGNFYIKEAYTVKIYYPHGDMQSEYTDVKDFSVYNDTLILSRVEGLTIVDSIYNRETVIPWEEIDVDMNYRLTANNTLLFEGKNGVDNLL